MFIGAVRVSTTAVVAAFLIGSLALAGCTGGSNMSVSPNPASTASGDRATARSLTQAAVLAADISSGIGSTGGPMALVRLVRDVSRGRRLPATGTATGACTNGGAAYGFDYHYWTERSQVTNSDGSVSVTTDLFYDPTCVMLESETILKVLTSSGPSSATGTITDYDKSGNVLGYVTLTMSLLTASNAVITLQESAATTVTGPAIAQLGETCTGPYSPENTGSCSVAHVGTSSGTTTAETMIVTNSGQISAVNVDEAVAIGLYLGNGLSLTQPSTTTWSVSGASLFNTGGGDVFLRPFGGSLTLKDVLYSYTTTEGISPSGFSVTTVHGSTPIATASIDAAGVGTLNYADGTSEPIAAGFVGV